MLIASADNYLAKYKLFKADHFLTMYKHCVCMLDQLYKKKYMKDCAK